MIAARHGLGLLVACLCIGTITAFNAPLALRHNSRVSPFIGGFSTTSESCALSKANTGASTVTMLAGKRNPLESSRQNLFRLTDRQRSVLGFPHTRQMSIEAASNAELENQVQEQGQKVRSMKEAIKANPDAHSKAELDAEVAKLKALKAELEPSSEPKPEEKKKAAPPPKPVESKKKPVQEEVTTSPREERAVRLGKAEKIRSKGKNPYEYTWPISHSTQQLQAEHEKLAAGAVADDAKVRVFRIPDCVLAGIKLGAI
jgi:hypothetical protein